MIQFQRFLAAWNLGRWRLRRRDVLAAAGWGVVLACLELAGREAVNDFADALLLSALCLLGLTTIAAHRTRPLAMVQGCQLVARRCLSRMARLFLIDYGVDLRLQPPIPRGFPTDWQVCLIALSSALAVLVPTALIAPGNVRDWLAPRFYLAYLLFLGALWVLVGLSLLVLALFAWTELINGWSLSFPRRLAPTSRRDRVMLAVFAAAVLSAACWLPVSWAFVVYALLELAVVAALWLTPSGLILVWRPKQGGVLRSFDGRWGWLSLGTVLIGFVTVLAWLCMGDRLVQPLWHHAGTSMPLSRALGAVLAWTGVAGLSAMTWQILRFVGPGILFNPESAPVLPTAADPDEQWRLRRRLEIQHRRSLTRGLEKLFKQAARWKWKRGSGFWIGLQHWFIYGLTRDEDESEFAEAVIGAPYHRAFPRAARHHFREITQALEVDLIYVEDGVSFRRFVRVLRVMFEVFDVHGGRQRAEDRHFLGLPGVRVLVENFELGQEPKFDAGHGYREPDYDEIGRARLLLVLKDRGDDVDHVEVPDESTGTPVFV